MHSKKHAGRVFWALAAFAVCLTVLLLPANAEKADASTISYEDIWKTDSSFYYDAEGFMSNTTAAAAVNYLQLAYPHESTWTGEGQCYGFAEKASSTIAKSRTQINLNIENSPENLKSVLKGLKAGAHVRMTYPENYWYTAHSFVVFKAGDKYVYWADANYGGANVVHYYSGTYDQLYSMYSACDRISYIVKTVSYKTYDKPLVKSARIAAGKPMLTWLKTANADTYKVYRAVSKSGTYKCVNTGKSLTFTDESAIPGYTYYYKIKAVKADGTSVFGNVTSRLCRIGIPRNIRVSEVQSSGHIKVMWDKVDKADKYRVYRSEDGGFSYRLVRTTDNTQYIDQNANDPGDGFKYVVKAVKSEAPSSSSLYSEETYYISPGIMRPDVTARVTDEARGEITLTWARVPYATGYYIYHGGDADELQENIDMDSYEKYISDDEACKAVFRYSSNCHYFKVTAVYDSYGYEMGKTSVRKYVKISGTPKTEA